jgi:hypothetical protein
LRSTDGSVRTGLDGVVGSGCASRTASVAAAYAIDYVRINRRLGGLRMGRADGERADAG